MCETSVNLLTSFYLESPHCSLIAPECYSPAKCVWLSLSVCVVLHAWIEVCVCVRERKRWLTVSAFLGLHQYGMLLLQWKLSIYADWKQSPELQ